VQLDFRILGPIEVVTDGRSVRLGGRRQRGVLALLLLHANEVMPVERLADELYEGAPPATAAAQIRDHVSQLRKLLGPAGRLLETRSPGYVLRVEPDAVDARRFEQLLEAASSDLRQGNDAQAAERLRDALLLWRGPALADVAYAPFAQPEVGRLEELRLTALERRIEADLKLGKTGALVGELEALVSQHPLREQFRAQLMLALYRAGRHAEAVSLYHDGRRRLVDELGIEPSAQLRRLAGLMLRQDDSLDSRPAQRAAATTGRGARNPYKGLQAFGEADAEDFFGRERLTGELVARLGADRFLAVVGPSGSGKSSVVFAGLLPALRAGAIPGSAAWPIAVITPGAYPLEELEAALLRVAVNPPPTLIEQLTEDDRGLLRAAKRVLPEGGSDLLLVVDQLEEVFTLVDDEARRTHFLSSIERAVRDPRSRLRVVTTLRADFYDRPLTHRGFAELLRDRVETVLPLGPDELERAIAGPAASVGVTLEEGLLTRIVTDVADEPGALPLLQYALTELYERRQGTTLTRAAYEAMGGVAGALAGRAEALYTGLGARGREAARQLFLRLVALGESVETRRRVQRTELDSLAVDQEELGGVLASFGTARLLSFDRDPRTQAPTVEVAHEALLREWARLHDWVAAARDDLRAHRRLSAAAVEWAEAGEDPSMLLRGGQLVRFESWAEDSGLARTDLERRYLEESVAAREAERVAEEDRRAREVTLERRSVRRLRALVGVLALAALVAGGLTILAFDQSSRSKRQARIARTRQLAAASIANLNADPQLSILLALQAVETSGGPERALPEAIDALHRAIAASRVLHTIRARVATASFSPDGSRLATAGPSGVALWNSKTGKRLARLAASSQSFRLVAFDPRGGRVAAATTTGAVTIWDVLRRRRLSVLAPPRPASVGTGLAFSPDGARLAVDGFAGFVGVIWIWDLRSGRVWWKTESESFTACGLAWSPDGARLATGDCGTHFSPSVGRIWDLAARRVVVETSPQSGALPAIAFSRDGRYIVTPNRSGFAQVWEARSGRLVATFTGHSGEVTSVAAGNGSEVATGGTDGTARVWDAETGKELVTLAGGSGPVEDVGFSRAGTRVVTAGADGTVDIWDITPEGSRDWMTLVAHPYGIESVAYDAAGDKLLTTGLTDPKAKLWDARSGRLLATYDREVDPGVAYIPGSGLAPQVSLESPDGRFGLDLHGSSESAVLRDASDGAVIARWGRNPQSAAFDSTGSRAALGNADGTVEIWDLRSRPFRQLRRFAAGSGRIDSVAFSPDGAMLATGGEDAQAALWDLRSERKVVTLFGPKRSVSALIFSPDGRRLAVGSRDGTVRIYVLPVDELMSVARSRLTRSWTADECRQYLAGNRCPSEP
jgi:WD40 repeat protein/DNA-binding SARP family transcriptional activator